MDVREIGPRFPFLAGFGSGWLVLGALGALLAVAVSAAAFDIGIVAALAAVAAGSIVLARRSPEALLAIWLASSPWLSFALRYPELQSVVTFDRIVIPAIVLGLVAKGVRRDGRLPRIHPGEVAAAVFACVALASVALASIEKGYALRTAFDSFVLPVALLYGVRTGFDVARGRTAIVAASVALGLVLPLPGLWEFATGSDLFAYQGASIFRTGIVRPNGPFVTDNSYAMIGATMALFVLWSPRALGVKVRGAATALWAAALAGCVLTAAIPLFRTVIACTCLAAMVPWLVEHRARSIARAVLVGLLVGIASLPAILAVSGTSVFRDRIVDPSSGFSRAATYLAGADIVGDRPILGVGLTNYHEYFVGKFGDAWYVEVETVGDEGAESYPHNNVLSVWAELGLIGLVPFAAAGIMLAGYCWRCRDVEALGLMAAYALPGITLVTCYSADLNLTVAALAGVLLARHGCGSDSLPRPGS